MSILDPTVQISLAKMFDLMWDDFLEGVGEDVESYIDASGLTEEFELTQEMYDTGEYPDSDVGDVMRRLNKDGSLVIRLATEARKQEQEQEHK